ncbi:MAG TPA: bacillithiol biosynthesis BshC [Planctomycetota bacterium]|nr:bacillithiol biosynthesis BshC [Planctomycetota bacterium]
MSARYPSLFVSYLRDDGRASALFAHRYRDPDVLVARARQAAGKGLEREVLDVLREYHRGLGAPAEAREALEKLGRGAAAVVTGQQPSPGGGPLYNLYKAATAIRLAEAIESRGVPCVAVFWNHSDDVRRPGLGSAFPDRENRVREVPLPPPEDPQATLFEEGSDEALRMFGAVLAEALPSTEFRPWLEGLIREAHRGSVAECFSRTLWGLLGRRALVVVEPRHLEGRRQAELFERHLADPGRFSRAVEEGRAAVRAAGFEDQLGREVGLDLFEIRAGRRFRWEGRGRPSGRLSAGVALRPLVQDVVLPTCAYVGGPGEVGYQAALLPAYRALEIEPPVVFPRATGTILEPKIARLIEKAGLTDAELFADGTALLPRFLGPEVPDVPGELERLGVRFLEEVDRRLGALAALPAMGRARERTAAKIQEALAALAERVREEQARQETTGRGQWAKLVTHVLPGGKLQERVFTPLYYACLFGPSLAEEVAGALDPFAFAHALLEPAV